MTEAEKLKRLNVDTFDGGNTGESEQSCLQESYMYSRNYPENSSTTDVVSYRELLCYSDTPKAYVKDGILASSTK